MLRVLHQLSCTVAPAQCEHGGSGLCWLLSYGINCANICVLPSSKLDRLSPSISWAFELRRVPLPLPAALAQHGIAQTIFRQWTFTNCTCSHPHHTPHWSASIRPTVSVPQGPPDHDGLRLQSSCISLLHAECQKRQYCPRKSQPWKSSRPLASATKKGR